MGLPENAAVRRRMHHLEVPEPKLADFAAQSRTSRGQIVSTKVIG